MTQENSIPPFPPNTPPEFTPPPTVAGHVYQVSKIMWLTVTDEEYQAFAVLAQYMPIPLWTQYPRKESSAFLPVEMALERFDKLYDGYTVHDAIVRDILRHAQSEGCDFITVRTA